MTRVDRPAADPTVPLADPSATHSSSAWAPAASDRRSPGVSRLVVPGGGGPPGGAPRRPSSPVAPADLQQAAYILAREVMGRPLPPAQQALLWQGNETRKTVLAMLPHGRGNVVTDVQRADNVGYRRTHAARAIVESWPRRGAFDPEIAALTALAGSGNCSEIVNLCAHVHAHHLQPGDRMLGQQVGFIDHTWMRVQCATPEGGEPGSGHAVIIDPWADGPVVDPSDTDLPSGDRGDVSTSRRMDARDADTATEAFRRARLDIAELHGQALADLADRGVSGYGALTDPVPLLTGRFVFQARVAVEATPTPLLRARAIEALQGSPANLTPERAAPHAQAVMNWALDLQRSHPRDVTPFRPTEPHDGSDRTPVPSR